MTSWGQDPHLMDVGQFGHLPFAWRYIPCLSISLPVLPDFDASSTSVFPVFEFSSLFLSPHVSIIKRAGFSALGILTPLTVTSTLTSKGLDATTCSIAAATTSFSISVDLNQV